MRVVFMGTPDFAVPSLKRLIADGHTVSLVVTQADKPKGRGQVMTPPPVKAFSLEKGLPVFQPTKMKTEETLETIKAATPDVIVVVAFGRILPPSILQLPRYGCVNVHGSLLPRYRGAAPIQWAVINGDEEAGVTTMQMNEGLDTGDMLLVSKRPLSEDMTGGELFDLLCEDGAALLSETLKGLESGSIQPIPQNDEDATYAPMLDKSMSRIDWSLPAKTLQNRIRGLNPWPSAVTTYKGKTLKIHSSKVGEPTNETSGTVISTAPLQIACGDGYALQPLQVQLEGSKRMAAEDFLRGRPMTVGEKLGE